MPEFYDDDYVLSRRFGPGVVVKWCHDDVYRVNFSNPTGDGPREFVQKSHEMEHDWIPSKK